MQVANTKTPYKLVGCLVLIAVVVCTAGLRHQRVQRDASVEWHDVSVALMEVERAKADLHESMQQRITKEQTSTGLRQQ